MRVQKWTGQSLGADQVGQRQGIAACRFGLKSGNSRRLRRAVAHTKRKSWQAPTQRPNRQHRIFRGEQDRRKITLRPVGRNGLHFLQRGNHHRITCKTNGKPLRGDQGPGQQDNRQLGLLGHAWGVTPARTPKATLMQDLTFLGIESSCDDTAAAVVRSDGTILASVVEGQTALHAAFGGVVPEIAARAHAERLDHCVEQALAKAGLGLSDLDGIAVTAGPGLIGGVLSGVMLAKGLAIATGLPLVGVNHLAGHALTPRLTDRLAFPYLMLLVSGGHCQFLRVDGPERFTRLGGSIDDAPGEAFDKVAKILALPQPGGPAVQAEAALGDAKRFPLPRPLLDRPGCDMSFSGLKTAVLRTRDNCMAGLGGLRLQDRRDICAAFQRAVADVLAEKTRRALLACPDVTALAVAGGVAANVEIRARLMALCTGLDLPFLAPPLALCTDNAAMIAWAGIERFQMGGRDGMELAARPRWPLDQTAPALIGSGKKGAKA
jgi:N6-L-threonylcarbamoyladenine synthase